MLECGSWQPVPAPQRREREESPSNFERWSLIDETPASVHEGNLTSFKERLTLWDDILPPLPRSTIPSQLGETLPFNPKRLDRVEFVKGIQGGSPTFTTRYGGVHYPHGHHECYELQGQLTSVWCVAASVQMVLDFYRYEYDQTRIAAALGLGDLNHPRPLPWNDIQKVVTILETLTSNALDANMSTSPTWREFVDEIDGDRPLISFIPGHSRCVGGWISGGWEWPSGPFTASYRFLTVYDPWPPTSGVITTYENYETTTYLRTFTAHVKCV